MTKTKLLEKISRIILIGEEAETKKLPLGSNQVIPDHFYHPFFISAIELIMDLFTKESLYYTAFVGHVSNKNRQIETGISILKEIRFQVEHDFLFDLDTMVAGEIFTDFLDMAEHFLSLHYKEAPAVLIGGVLEERLRKMCTKHGLDILKPNGKPKEAEALNTDLYAGKFISLNDKKNLTGYIGIRNSAAHMKPDEFTIDQVQIMLLGVREFIARQSI